MRPDARTVLVAGGTRGIGRAIGLAFARTGARVVLTHRWGSVAHDELAACFRAAGAAPPEVVEADAANADDTRALLARTGPVDVFIANVCVVGRGTGTIEERDLTRSLDYSAWPLLRYLDALQATFGALPAYVVATSSDGPDRFYPGYDYVAASKAVVEALCRRLAPRFPDMRINAVRARQVDTAGYREMFGPVAREVIGRFSSFDVTPDEVAGAVVALCGGDLDGLSGEVVTVDRGAGPIDNLVNVAPVLLRASFEHASADAATEGRLHHADARGGETAAAGQSLSLSPPMAQSGTRQSAEGARAEAPDRAPGVLWIDAGVRPDDVDLCRPVHVVSVTDAARIEGGRIPDCVVVGCDWSGRADDDRGCATLLPALLERAERDDAAPRYAVRVDRGVDPAAPGEALGRTVDRYWGAWRAGTATRVNAIRYTDDRHRPQAVAAVRALLSGALDGVRGQRFDVTRGARP